MHRQKRLLTFSPKLSPLLHVGISPKCVYLIQSWSRGRACKVWLSSAQPFQRTGYCRKKFIHTTENGRIAIARAYTRAFKRKFEHGLDDRSMNQINVIVIWLYQIQNRSFSRDLWIDHWFYDYKY